MPPKIRFSQKDVLEAAFELLRERGISAIGARQVAARLHCSTQPIFSCFSNMESLTDALIRKTRDLYNEYISRGLAKDNAFKGVGMNYLAFAANEPQLFKLLFMNGDHRRPETALDIDENRRLILKSVMVRSGLNENQADELYYKVWIFTHGIAAMLAAGTVDFPIEERERLLKESFVGLLMEIKSRI